MVVDRDPKQTGPPKSTTQAGFNCSPSSEHHGRVVVGDPVASKCYVNCTCDCPALMSLDHRGHHSSACLLSSCDQSIRHWLQPE